MPIRLRMLLSQQRVSGNSEQLIEIRRPEWPDLDQVATQDWLKIKLHQGLRSYSQSGPSASATQRGKQTGKVGEIRDPVHPLRHWHWHRRSCTIRPDADKASVTYAHNVRVHLVAHLGDSLRS